MEHMELFTWSFIFFAIIAMNRHLFLPWSSVFRRGAGTSQSSSRTVIGDSEEEFHDALRPITMDDLILSLNKMKESKLYTGGLQLPKLDMD
jgi:hypothetical protein